MCLQDGFKTVVLERLFKLEIFFFFNQKGLSRNGFSKRIITALKYQFLNSGILKLLKLIIYGTLYFGNNNYYIYVIVQVCDIQLALLVAHIFTRFI